MSLRDVDEMCRKAERKEQGQINSEVALETTHVTKLVRVVQMEADGSVTPTDREFYSGQTNPPLRLW